MDQARSKKWLVQLHLAAVWCGYVLWALLFQGPDDNDVELLRSGFPPQCEGWGRNPYCGGDQRTARCSVLDEVDSRQRKQGRRVNSEEAGRWTGQDLFTRRERVLLLYAKSCSVPTETLLLLKECSPPLRTAALTMMAGNHSGGGTPIILVSRRKKEDESRGQVGSSTPINKWMSKILTIPVLADGDLQVLQEELDSWFPLLFACQVYF